MSGLLFPSQRQFSFVLLEKWSLIGRGDLSSCNNPAIVDESEWHCCIVASELRQETDSSQSRTRCWRRRSRWIYRDLCGSSTVGYEFGVSSFKGSIKVEPYHCRNKYEEYAVM